MTPTATADPQTRLDVERAHAEAVAEQQRLARGDGPTMKHLLERGRAVLAGREAKRLEWEDLKRQQAAAAWRSLLAAARATMGEVLGDQPAAPPDGFSPHQPHLFELRPFGAAELLARFAPAVTRQNEATWVPTEVVNAAGKTYRVGTAYAPEFDPDLGDGYPVLEEAAYTDDLAEAVALCERAGASYTAALEKATAPQSAPPKEPELPRDDTGKVLTPDEKAALEALSKAAVDHGKAIQGKSKKGG